MRLQCSVVLQHVVEGRSVKQSYNASSLPAVKQMPMYKAWAYLPSNECAVQTGRQMYYMDPTTGAALSGSSALELWVLVIQGSKLKDACEERFAWIIGEAPEVYCMQ